MMIKLFLCAPCRQKIETSQLADSACALRKRDEAHAEKDYADSTRAQKAGQQTLSALEQSSANLNAF
jgi:hypothetical protein